MQCSVVCHWHRKGREHSQCSMMSANYSCNLWPATHFTLHHGVSTDTSITSCDAISSSTHWKRGLLACAPRRTVNLDSWHTNCKGNGYKPTINWHHKATLQVGRAWTPLLLWVSSPRQHQCLKSRFMQRRQGHNHNLEMCQHHPRVNLAYQLCPKAHWPN